MSIRSCKKKSQNSDTVFLDNKYWTLSTLNQKKLDEPTAYADGLRVAGALRTAYQGWQSNER